jgi:predicted nucleic acid-binding protein
VKILLDTNIILDYALERQPYFRDSEIVLLMAEQGRIEGYISALTFSDLYYIIRKDKHCSAPIYKPVN